MRVKYNIAKLKTAEKLWVGAMKMLPEKEAKNWNLILATMPQWVDAITNEPEIKVKVNVRTLPSPDPDSK